MPQPKKRSLDDDLLDDIYADTGAYDTMLDENDEGAIGEPTTKGGDPGSQKSDIDVAKELEQVKSQHKNSQELVRQLVEENKKLKGNFKKIEKAFGPSPEEDGEKVKEVEEDLFDEDPTGFVNQVVEKSVSKLREERQVEKIEENAAKAMEEINMEYDVPWKKDGVKEEIQDALASLDTSFKHKNPKLALERAIRITGHGKKRARRLPYYETTLSPADAQRRKKSLAAKYKEKFLAPMKEQTPLDDFFNNFAKT